MRTVRKGSKMPHPYTPIDGLQFLLAKKKGEDARWSPRLPSWMGLASYNDYKAPY